MKLELERSDGVAVVTFRADVLDASTVSEFKNQMTQILKTDHRVVFDMTELQFVDSSGVGAILSCLRTLNAEGGDLKLCSLTKPVRTLFELIRMHRIFDIFNSQAEAVATF